MKKEEIIKHILNNPDSTMAELMAATGKVQSVIRNICIELGIKAVTPKQKRLDYIKSNPGKTVNEYAAELDVKKAAVREYLKELGVKAARKIENVVHRSYTKEEEPGLIDIAEEIFQGITDEERRKLTNVIEKKFLITK